MKSWLIGKVSDAGRDWGQEEKGTTEDEMAGWHHRLDGREFEWTPGVGEGQKGLACCNSWGCKESDTTERLNWTELNWVLAVIKNMGNNKCFQGCGKIVSIHYWQDYKMVQPLWKTVCWFFKKLNTELAYDVAIPLLGIYHKEVKTGLQKILVYANVPSRFIHNS